MDILSTTEVLSDGTKVLLIIGVMIAVFCLVGGLMLVADNDGKLGSVLIALFIGLVITMVIGGLKSDKILEHRVIITDIKEFDYNKYKIIEQDGKTFRIKEIK